jgi:cytochrome c oxidase assembly protein subunit 15
MSTHTEMGAAAGTGAADGGRRLRRLGGLALFAAIYTYALIVFGGIVRITGSGMGCGDDWPRCHGQWIPAFTLEVFIEYMHRLLAAGIGLVVLAVFVYAVVHRRKDGFAGPLGVLRPLGVAALLLAFQVALGAITVRMELPTWVTVTHFITAMLFMAALIVTAARAGAFGSAARHPAADAPAGRRALRLAAAALALGFVVVAFGGLTANLPGAPLACQGFPLCNGRVLPANVLPVHVHWAHRLLAFLLLLHVAGAAVAAGRRGASSAVRRAAVASALLVTLQVAVAAALVLLYLPASLQALHLAVGAAIWFALVAWVELARRDARVARAAAPAPNLDPVGAGR